MSHHPCGPSRLGLRSMCPGSLRMEEEAKRQGLALELWDEEASEGTLLHSLLDPAATLPELTEEQHRILMKAREYVAKKTEGASQVFYERMMGLWVGESTEPLTFGSCDIAALFPDEVRIIDIKFGRLEPDGVSIYRQLHAYCAMAMWEFERPLAKAWVYSPRLEKEWDGEFRDLKIQTLAIESVIAAATDPNAQLHPSAAACRFCLAKPVCPAFKGETETLPAKKEQLLPTSPEKVAQLLEWCPTVEAAAEAIRKHARKMLEEGQQLPGWQLGERTIRKVVGVEAAFACLPQLKQSELLGACKVGITDLEKTFVDKMRKETGCTFKHARDEFDRAIESAVTMETTKYLKRRNA